MSHYERCGMRREMTWQSRMCIRVSTISIFFLLKNFHIFIMKDKYDFIVFLTKNYYDAKITLFMESSKLHYSKKCGAAGKSPTFRNKEQNLIAFLWILSSHELIQSDVWRGRSDIADSG